MASDTRKSESRNTTSVGRKPNGSGDNVLDYFKISWVSSSGITSYIMGPSISYFLQFDVNRLYEKRGTHNGVLLANSPIEQAVRNPLRTLIVSVCST